MYILLRTLCSNRRGRCGTILLKKSLSKFNKSLLCHFIIANILIYKCSHPDFSVFKHDFAMQNVSKMHMYFPLIFKIFLNIFRHLRLSEEDDDDLILSMDSMEDFRSNEPTFSYNK